VSEMRPMANLITSSDISTRSISTLCILIDVSSKNVDSIPAPKLEAQEMSDDNGQHR
jgi:hypothetical protein